MIMLHSIQPYRSSTVIRRPGPDSGHLSKSPRNTPRKTGPNAHTKTEKHLRRSGSCLKEKIIPFARTSKTRYFTP